MKTRTLARWAGASALCLALTSCGTVVIDPPKVEPGPVLDVRAKSVEITPELIPSDLKDRVGIVGYASESLQDRTLVRMTLENLTTSDTFVFELSALFSDAAGTRLFTTEWERAELKPGAKHEFYAETADKGARMGTILMRQILPEPVAAPAQPAPAVPTKGE